MHAPYLDKAKFRLEQDMMGERQLPVDCLYGIQTMRAVENFPITGITVSDYPELVRALAMVKQAAALANRDLTVLEPEIAEAIHSACDEIVEGRHHEHFVVDMMQGGAGTSTNMNANEVIANIALRRLGHLPGDYRHLHPNDHVNRSQSTNDVYPTAIRLAILMLSEDLTEALKRLSEALFERAEAFKGMAKVGRTQLQDAVPMTLGMEFAGFAVTVQKDEQCLKQAAELLKEINLGGTAIGTGVTAPKGYDALAVTHLSQISGYSLTRARDLVEASSDLGALVTFSGVLKRIAVKLSKICNDLRLLSSGPRAGLGEIVLPAVQPGSSIMPGKVNPVIPEVVNQIAYQVIGNELTVTIAAEAGQMQLNAMEPVIVFNILQSTRMLINGLDVLRDRCVVGIQGNAERCEQLLNGSLVHAAVMVPYIGYEKAVAIAVTAQQDGSTLPEAASKLGYLTSEEVHEILRADAAAS